MTKAALQACYSDWKLIRTRGVVQLVFEIPIHESGSAHEILGGMPNPAAEVWCAIARLEEPKPEADKPKREKRSWDEMTAAQQAGVLCNEPAFHKFLSDEYNAQITHAVAATEYVRSHCGVHSRSEIDKSETAQASWTLLVSRYRTWQRYPELVDA